MAKFTGVNTCFYKVDYQSNASIKNALSNAFSMEMLYMSNSTNNNNPFSAMEGGGTGFEQQNGGQIQFWIRLGSAYVTVNTGQIITPGAYYHVVAVYDKAAGKVLVYVNGSKAVETVVSGNFAFPSNVGAHWFGIGGDAQSSGGGLITGLPLNGEVGIARIYGKALSRDEVYLLYNDRLQNEE
jgi:hypothetical protein